MEIVDWSTSLTGKNVIVVASWMVCEESMSSELVIQDLGDTENNTCITQHPGFRPVCLEK